MTKGTKLILIKVLIIVLLIISILVVVKVIRNKNQNKVDEIWEVAMQYERQEQYDKAINELEYIKLNYPNSKYWQNIDSRISDIKSKQLYMEAADYSRKGQYVNAIVVLKTLLDKYPNEKIANNARRDINEFNKKISELWAEYYELKEAKKYDECQKKLVELNKYTLDDKIIDEYDEIENFLDSD